MTRSVSLAALLVLSGSPLLAQSEGVASFHFWTHGEGTGAPDGQYRVAFSRPAVRMEMEMSPAAGSSRSPESRRAAPTMKMTMIQKLAEPEKLYLLDDRRKTYSIMDLAKAREAGPAPEETWSAKRLGSDRVAGFACEKALMTSSKGTQVEVCMSSDLPATKAWWAAMSRGRRASDNWVRSMEDAGVRGFPIRMRYRNADGRPGVAMELAGFERRSVTASAFEIPADYKQTSGMDAANVPPEAGKAMQDALEKMTPEQRKAYEEMMKRQQPPNR